VKPSSLGFTEADQLAARFEAVGKDVHVLAHHVLLQQLGFQRLK
jgi:hypothetical protein